MKAGHSKNVWKISTGKKKINLFKFTVMTRVMGGGLHWQVTTLLHYFVNGAYTAWIQGTIHYTLYRQQVWNHPNHSPYSLYSIHSIPSISAVRYGFSKKKTRHFLIWFRISRTTLRYFYFNRQLCNYILWKL